MDTLPTWDPNFFPRAEVAQTRNGYSRGHLNCLARSLNRPSRSERLPPPMSSLSRRQAKATRLKTGISMARVKIDKADMHTTASTRIPSAKHIPNWGGAALEAVRIIESSNPETRASSLSRQAALPITNSAVTRDVRLAAKYRNWSRRAAKFDRDQLLHRGHSNISRRSLGTRTCRKILA